jgi:hypothetical protein
VSFGLGVGEHIRQGPKTQALARRMPTTTPSLRTQSRALHGFTAIAATLICYRRLSK